MSEHYTKFSRGLRAAALVAALMPAAAGAVPVTDPNDGRSWQGATVGTFAGHFFGSDTPANRKLVVDFANAGANSMLDDGIFDPTGFVTGSLEATPWATGGGGGCLGISGDSTGTGSLGYSCSGSSVFTQANSIDNRWDGRGHS